MFKQLLWFCLGAVIALSATQVVKAYDQSVFDNLNRSRDALLDQRQHLQEQYDQVAKMVDQYQQKLSILDGYLKQNDQAIRDIDLAMRGR